MADNSVDIPKLIAHENDCVVINERENAVLVRQEDVACRYPISLSNLCWLHEST